MAQYGVADALAYAALVPRAMVHPCGRVPGRPAVDHYRVHACQLFHTLPGEHLGVHSSSASLPAWASHVHLLMPLGALRLRHRVLALNVYLPYSRQIEPVCVVPISAHAHA